VTLKCAGCGPLHAGRAAALEGTEAVANKVKLVLFNQKDGGSMQELIKMFSGKVSAEAH